MTEFNSGVGGGAVKHPSPQQYPAIYDTLGQQIPTRSEDYIEGRQPGRTRAWGTSALPPLGWNQGRPDGTRMVGWTLTQKGKSRIIAEHAFSINPQAITRANQSRNQLFATQAHFYVDDFGPGSTSIQINQLVAHGRGSTQAGGDLARATMRDDVLRWYDVIYLQATANPKLFDVYFYDNHLYEAGTGSVPERVYFPSQGAQLTRSVQQHNVWQLQITMGTLDPAPSQSKNSPQVTGQPSTRQHIVQNGETLTKIAAQLAGSNVTHQRVLQLKQQIQALTKKYGSDDITKTRVITTFGIDGQVTGTAQIQRLHLGVGEKIVLPAG